MPSDCMPSDFKQQDYMPKLKNVHQSDKCSSI